MSEIPRVKTTENVLNILTSPQGAGITAMICSATWGPLDEVKIISSLSDYKKNYGNDSDDVTGYKGAKAFFKNGGILKVIRIAHTGYAQAEHTFKDGSSNDAIIIKGKYSGTYGNNITVTIVDNNGNVDIYLSNGDVNESYYNLSSNTEVINAINSGDLCEATIASGNPSLVAPITATYLTGGNDGVDNLADSDYTTAFDNYLKTEDYRYLIIPGKTDNAFQATMVSKLNTRAIDEKKYSRYITGITKNENISTIKARTLSGRRVTLCAPSLVMDGTTLDGSYLACALAGKLCYLGVGVSATNKTLNIEVDKNYTKPQQSELLDNSVTVIANSNKEIKCIKDMTRYNDLTSPYKLGVVSDEIDYAREKYEQYLIGQLGQPNTAINRATISGGIDTISAGLINDKIIESANESTVVIGASADSIEATVSILPIYSIDYIDLTINIQ